MKKAFIIYTLTVICFFSARAQDSISISLFDCLKKAKDFHPYSSDNKYIEDIRLLKARNISTLWLPQLNLNGQATYQSDAIKIDVPIPGVNMKGAPQDQYKVTLDVNQIIYDGGLSRAERRITNASIDGDLQQNETDIYKINDQVSSVYFNLLFLQKNKQVYTNTLEDLKSKEQKIASNVRNGILLQSDWDNLKAEMLKTNQMLDDIDYTYKSNFEILEILTGDSLLRTYKLMVPEVQVSFTDSIDRPEIKGFDIQKISLEGAKYVSGTQKMPKLYAFSQFGYGRPGLNMLKDSFQPYYIIGLKFQWNLWDWNKSQREQSIYTVQQNIVDSKKENYIRNVQISSKNELTKIQQLENTLKTDQEILTLRKDIAIQTDKRLNQGVITMTDYLNEYNAEIKARLQLETHRLQLTQSKINYMIIKGILKTTVL
jgi:outer membrane protein TolC